MVDTLEEAFALGDRFASEHAQILTAEPRRALTEMHDFGALFLGERTCVSFGDKAIGTNHVLPTLGAARYTGGLWVGKFLKTVTYQEIDNDESSAELGRSAAVRRGWRTSRVTRGQRMCVQRSLAATPSRGATMHSEPRAQCRPAETPPMHAGAPMSGRAPQNPALRAKEHTSVER